MAALPDDLVAEIQGARAEIETLRLALSGAVLLLIGGGIGNFGPDAHEVAYKYYMERVDPEGTVEPNIYAGLELINKAMAN